MERPVNSINAQSSLILAAIIVVLLIAIGAWLVYRKRQSRRLEKRFGPEYGRAVDELGSRAKAESSSWIISFSHSSEVWCWTMKSISS